MAGILCGDYSLRQAVTPIFPPVELRRCTATGARSLSMATPATEEQLRRGTVYRGDVELLRRVLRRASRGEPLTFWVFGGSISMGRDLPTRNTDQRRANASNFFVEPQGMFADMLADWLQQELPPRDGARHRVFNFAQGARDSHGSIRPVEQALSAAGADEQAAALRAAGHRAPGDARPDLVFLEFAYNDAVGATRAEAEQKAARGIEGLLRLLRASPRTREAAIVSVNFFPWFPKSRYHWGRDCGFQSG